jgi:hypothetical protein
VDVRKEPKEREAEDRLGRKEDFLQGWVDLGELDGSSRPPALHIDHLVQGRPLAVLSITVHGGVEQLYVEPNYLS